jgi:glycosyltransferase involved in cell wall biosynthesis
MTGPQVSILIPAYNPRFFAEAFASARAQKHPSLEIVVRDDSAGTLIGDCVLAANDPRVRYLRNPDRLGFEGNFTRCLRDARGELVKFLNDDDRLHEECVARLAAGFASRPEVRLATSRRRVIDASGVLAPDIPATTPLAHVSCVIDGFELGNVALINSLNLIGEPSTVMFRRADVDCDANGIFTWAGTPYHCLADLSLWLRLLTLGEAYYYAAPLCEYRMHGGQEQRALGIDCITERYYLAVQARRAGFLRDPAQYRMALSRVDFLAGAWAKRASVNEGERESLSALSRSIAQELARLPS